MPPDSPSRPKPLTTSQGTESTGLLGRQPTAGQSRGVPTEAAQKRAIEVKDRVQERVFSALKIKDVQPSPELRRAIEELFQQVLLEDGIVLGRAERAQLLETIINEIAGLGPLEPLLTDDATTDIMIVGTDRVYVERHGKMVRTNVSFDSEAHLKHIIDRITSPLGRHVDENSPMVDARLRDGSRVNAVVRPVALDGPVLTIRKFSAIPLTEVDLIRFGTANAEVFEFMRAAVIAGFNIIVSGGSSTGKTTLLNVLSGFVPTDERIVTIENAAELQLRQPHVVRLETRPPNIEGKGEISVRELVVNALRMRPDRIIVGEVRSSETLDLLQAMNTGHEGSMGTVHSNTAKDAISRLEVMVLSSGMQLPVRAIREQIASAIDLIIHMGRTRDGVRRILQIAEITGIEGDTIILSDLFAWEQAGISEGQTTGFLKPTGLIPRKMFRIEDSGIRLSPAIFGLRDTSRVSAHTPPPRAEPSSGSGKSSP